MATNSLEFMALEEEIEDLGGDEFGDMDGMDSALDMLGEADQAADDIAAKMDLE